MLTENSAESSHISFTVFSLFIDEAQIKYNINFQTSTQSSDRNNARNHGMTMIL
jgi:hypothetical protein